jgi:predicted transcriptional regulator
MGRLVPLPQSRGGNDAWVQLTEFVFPGLNSAFRIRFARSSASAIPLDMAAGNGNMGSHIIKTTIEIADDLFERAQRVARSEKTTFRLLTEQGLRLVVEREGGQVRQVEMEAGNISRPRLTEEFKNASWDKIRDEICKGHGA